jgi:hypothetical protein
MHPPLITLESIQIASPCRADWNAMQPIRGNNCIRFCPGCGKNVYNLSGMTRDEAMHLLEEKEGKLCVRLRRRADGTVITSDCPVGQAAQKKRGAVAGLFVTVAGMATAFFGVATILFNRSVDVPQTNVRAPKLLLPKVLAPNIPLRRVVMPVVRVPNPNSLYKWVNIGHIWRGSHGRYSSTTSDHCSYRNSVNAPLDSTQWI